MTASGQQITATWCMHLQLYIQPCTHTHVHAHMHAHTNTHLHAHTSFIPSFSHFVDL